MSKDQAFAIIPPLPNLREDLEYASLCHPLSQNALADRSTPAENCAQLLETSDEIIAWTHNVKSHQIMVAHLCSPTEGVEVRKSAYVMNEILSARKSTPAF